MNKIKLLLISCVLLVAVALSGCIRMETAFVVHENNTVTLNVKYAFNKQKAIAGMKEMAAEMGGVLTTKEIEEAFAEYSEETINGEQYYVESESQTYTQKQLQEEGFPAIINKDKFYLYAASDMAEGIDDISEIEQEMASMGLSMDDIEYIGFSVKLTSPVVKTNGIVQENDPTTVVWELAIDSQEYELYAYTANVTADPAADRQTVLTMLADNNSSSGSKVSGNGKDKKAPVIKGIKKNKTYKKKVTVYVKDNKKLKKVTVNGKKVKLTKVKKGKYKGYYKFTVKKKGKNTIVAYDTAGNKKKISIKIK